MLMVDDDDAEAPLKVVVFIFFCTSSLRRAISSAGRLRPIEAIAAW
jgi:hypothetical protein